MKAPLGGAGEGKNSDSVAQGPDAEGIFFFASCPITTIL